MAARPRQNPRLKIYEAGLESELTSVLEITLHRRRHPPPRPPIPPPLPLPAPRARLLGGLVLFVLDVLPRGLQLCLMRSTFFIVHRQSPLGPVDPSFRALSRRLKFMFRRHKFNKDSPLLEVTC